MSSVRLESAAEGLLSDAANGESHLGAHSVLTPEKLAIMKLNAAADFDREVLSEPVTPTGRSFQLSSLKNGSSRMSRSTRQVSSASRRTTQFMHGHREKMSLELATQAESKFFALMELMSSASKEAASLKDFWGKLMSERESWSREREELLMQIDEVSVALQTYETQQNHHKREHGQRKKEVDRLLLELSVALSGVSEWKKKVTERDSDLERHRVELQELRVTLSRSQADHAKLRTEFESVQSDLRVCEAERDNAREDVDKYRSELRTLTHSHTELKTKASDLTIKLETSQKEILTLTERIRGWERERTEIYYERDRLNDELRKATLKAEESARNLTDVVERLERVQKEHHRTKEHLHTVELERDEFSSTIDRVRVELKDKTAHYEEAESRAASLNLKLEQLKRESVGKDERLADLETEVLRLRQRLTTRDEEHSHMTIERDQLRDDLESDRKTTHELRRQISTLQESLSHRETTISDLRSELVNLKDKLLIIERERDDARDKHHHSHGAHGSLKHEVATLQAEIRTLTEAADRHRKEAQDFRRKYEEITETVTEWRDDSGELEFEIENLRSMLREARQQKERAITARNSADHERDEAIAKYEEKCREMESWEESRSSYLHSHSGRGESRMSSTRVFSRSTTGKNNGFAETSTAE